MPEWGIRLIAYGGQALPGSPWLSYYDPDAGDDTRTGLIDASENPAKALRFADAAAATACWRQQSTRVPLRLDGEPNRPLTAFTVEVMRLPE